MIQVGKAAPENAASNGSSPVFSDSPGDSHAPARSPCPPRYTRSASNARRDTCSARQRTPLCIATELGPAILRGCRRSFASRPRLLRRHPDHRPPTRYLPGAIRRSRPDRCGIPGSAGRRSNTTAAVARSMPVRLACVERKNPVARYPPKI